MFSIILLGGLGVLAAWAIGNISLGLVKRKNSSNSEKYYWEMNALWNIINLSIAIIGSIYVAFNYSSLAQDASLQALQIKIVAINIIFDIFYIAIGLWLESRGKKQTNNRFIGYGNSIQLQGAFLFCFDSMFALGLIIAYI